MPGADRPVLRPDPDAFVGRSQELTDLERDLQGAPHPRGPVRLLRGPAGIGKTRLAEELSRRALASGTRVVWGHSAGEVTAPPYWHWTQVVRALAGSSRGTDLAALVVEDPGSVDRLELFDATAAHIRAAAAAGEGPLLIVLDDLHVAEQATWQLTRFLVRQLRDVPMLVVATVRTGSADDPVLIENLEALGRHGVDLETQGLSVDALADLLNDPDLADAVHAVTGGNPLHVHQVVRDLHPIADPVVPTTAAELDGALRRSVTRRVRTVEGSARAVLDAAAVLGPDFDLGELSAIVEPLDEETVDAAVGFLRAEGFLTHSSPARFQHPLIAETVAEEMAESERHRLHLRAARSMRSVEDRMGEAAHHLHRAGPDHRQEAVAALRQAAARSSAAAAHEDAAVHLFRAREAVEAGTDARLRLEVLLDLGGALWRSGRTADADQAYEDAWAQAEELDDPDSSALAALRNGIEYYFADDARPDIRQRVELALAAQPSEPSPTKARILAALATHHLGQTLPTGKALADEAVTMARRFDDPLALGSALIARVLTDLGPATLTRRIADGHEILECARRSDNYRLTVHGRFLLMVALLEAGDLGGLDGELLQQEGFTEDLGEPRFTRHSLWLRATRAMFEGDVAGAERLAEQTLEMSERLADPDAHGVYGGQIGVLRWMQGRVIEMEPVYAAMREAEPFEPLWPSVLAWLWMIDGRLDASRGALDAVPDPGTLPGGIHWLLTATTYAAVAAEIGSDAQVDAAWNALVPYAEHMVPVAMGAAMWGAVARPLGHLALRRGEVDEGIEYLRSAVRTCARSGAKPWLIECQLDLADALDRHRPGDPDARAVRTEASEAAHRLGLDLFRQRIEATETPSARAAAGPGATWAVSSDPARPEQIVPSRPQVRVIGGFNVIGLDGTPARWTSRKARELLKILVSRRGVPINRETLMEMLWPDDASSSSSLANRLSVALSTVRRALDPQRSLPASDLVSTTVDAVALNLAVVDVDVEQVLAGARSILGAVGRPEGEATAAGAAADLLDRHRGEALPDELHADWAVGVRVEVRLAMTSLARLVAEDAEREGHAVRAAEAHRRILDMDPYDEAANLGLTAAFRAMGAHGQAELAYSSYTRRMVELGVPTTSER